MTLGAIATAVLILAAAAGLQSTLLNWIALRGVKPDISLVILVFIAHSKGRMVGQVLGFLAGFVEDLLSLSPLGFHALIKTLLGTLYGMTKGNIFVDTVFAPIILVAVATVGKALLAGLVGVVFSVPSVDFSYFLGKLWIELAYNSILAPFAFALLKRIPVLTRQTKEVS